MGIFLLFFKLNYLFAFTFTSNFLRPPGRLGLCFESLLFKLYTRVYFAPGSVASISFFFGANISEPRLHALHAAHSFYPGM